VPVLPASGFMSMRRPVLAGSTTATMLLLLHWPFVYFLGCSSKLCVRMLLHAVCCCGSRPSCFIAPVLSLKLPV
jgi:hypothetical protein